jgi:hypothetical protein
MSAPIALATVPATAGTPAAAATGAPAASTDGDLFAGLLSTLAAAPASAGNGRSAAHLPKTPASEPDAADDTAAPGDAAAVAASAVAATLALTPPAPPVPSMPSVPSAASDVGVIKTGPGSPQSPLGPLDHGEIVLEGSPPTTAGGPATYSPTSGHSTAPENADETLALGSAAVAGSDHPSDSASIAANASAAPPAIAGAQLLAPATTPPTSVIKTGHGSPQQPVRPLDHDRGSIQSSAQLPSGPAPVVAAAGDAAPVAVAPTTPAPSGSAPVDPQPALTATLARLRSHGDGSHELSVQLHPAELGAVNVSATIRDGQLTVTVACADAAARAAVTAALPALHHQLSSAGFGGVDVHFGGPTHGHDQPGASADQRPDQSPDQRPDQSPDQRSIHARTDDRPDRDNGSTEPATTSATRRPAPQRALDRLL